MNKAPKDVAKLINYTHIKKIYEINRGVDWLKLNAIANTQFPTNQPTRTNGPNYWKNPQDCYVITFWMCTITARALVKPMHTKQTAQYNRIPFTFSTDCVLRVSVNHYHIPSTLFLDSCFSGSTLEVTAEAGDFSAVTEVICRHIMWVLI